MAKNKRQKVKHYNRSFYSRETRVKRGIGIVVLVAAVLAAAWFAAPHVLDWATHTWYTVVRDRDLSASSAVSESASSGAQSTAASEPAASSVPEKEPEPEVKGTDIVTGLWAEVDVTTLTDEAAIRAAARQLKQQGADYALVTLKDAAGTVYYASGVAAAAQSITENPVDAANIAAILREEGIIPAAQLAAFTDPVSVYTDRSMGVHYDGNRLWLDNVSAAKGGKAWMNPFAASAVQFVGDLIEEVRSMGYEQVVLTGVQFPNIITRKQDFGASGGKSREGRAAQLTADIAAWQTRFAGSVTLWVSYPDALCTAATDALGTTGTSLGMENLLVTSSTALDADSRAALEQAAAAIESGGPVTEPKPTVFGKFMTYIVNPIFYATCVHDRAFTVDDSCIGCGKCASLCPMNNIELQGGKPRWNGHCTHCMACISYCPKAAIAYGKKSRTRRIYTCPPYRPAER